VKHARENGRTSISKLSERKKCGPERSGRCGRAGVVVAPWTAWGSTSPSSGGSKEKWGRLRGFRLPNFSTARLAQRRATSAKGPSLSSGGTLPLSRAGSFRNEKVLSTLARSGVGGPRGPLRSTLREPVDDSARREEKSRRPSGRTKKGAGECLVGWLPADRGHTGRQPSRPRAGGNDTRPEPPHPRG
jgi:hypothetical protein